MSLVEKELTLKNIELARNKPELEKYTETEHKLVPLHPTLVGFRYRHIAMPVEQIYLSNPEDEFSLRVRRELTPNGPEYTATQKDRGEILGSALSRREISTPISEEAYEHYQAMENLPRVQKLRAHVTDSVTIDFYENSDTPVIVEIEHPDLKERALLIEAMQKEAGPLIERSNDSSLINEAIAHATHNGEFARRTPESLDTFTHKVLGEMLAQYATGKNQVVVGLTGMSGSGKTTVTNALQEQIVELFGEQYKPTVLSTDDYHFGKTKLEEMYGSPYMDWDSSKTYNTTELAFELERLAHGESLIKRRFDFDSEEPVFEDEEITPSPFVIIEGLYAGSGDLTSVRDLHFELPTSIATSVGRDLRRLVIENRANRAFPTPESRLRYQIETAVPLYLEQQRPKKHAFSASTRPLAERAFVLAKYAEL